MCNILVVEDEKALAKMWTVSNELDKVKKIVVYTGKVTKESYNEDVMTWAEVIALGNVLLQILQLVSFKLVLVKFYQQLRQDYMVLTTLCAPALIYLMFSVTQIVIDTFQHKYNLAIMKLWVSFVITILMQQLKNLWSLYEFLSGF